jgi:hypothetical protein
MAGDNSRRSSTVDVRGMAVRGDRRTAAPPALISRKQKMAGYLQPPVARRGLFLVVSSPVFAG